MERWLEEVSVAVTVIQVKEGGPALGNGEEWREVVGLTSYLAHRLNGQGMVDDYV